ncbi:neuroblast differentiation-associated protein AHNAK-like [Myxocyprinus asiaticus]|uniref:neuroblast differentiation-associated protein AHNAK-like n=1 Tax=Myxocyprinus asiaticus TaxID=70543 RepID=UPI0022216108|nr:neuroblast differentiation-associated protein AHNAK-like [Myxocyprinus asiaticus]
MCQQMWKDSYEKLFNAKVKKFMIGNQAVQENKDGFHNGSLTGHSERLASDLSNSHLMDFPAADCKIEVNVAAFLQNADRMRLTPYAAEPANKFRASMSYDDTRNSTSIFNSDLLLQGRDLMRVGKIKADTASDVDNEINLHGGKFKDPKIDLGISTPDSNLALPNTKGAPVIELTKGSFRGPKAGLYAHNIDMDVPSSKFKKPKLKPSKFNFPGFNKTDIAYDGSKGSKLAVSSSELGAGLNDSNIQFDGTKADLKGLKTNLTLSDMDMPSRKLKMPTFNLSDFGLSGPKIKMPDYELKTSEIDLSAPKIKADFDSPDFNIRGHKPDITAPDMNVDNPKGKIKGPHLNKPNLDVNAPDLDINAPSGKLKLPKFGFSGSEPKCPDFKINSPKLNLKSPKIKGGLECPDMDLTLPQSVLEGPNLDINSPEINFNSPSGKFNMQKIKMPSFGLSGLKEPQMNVGADIERPDINLSTSTTKLNAGINDPDIDIHGPNADLKAPKTELKLPDMDMSSGKLKTPTFNMPNFGLSGPKIKTPEMDLSAPKIKADLNSPDFNIRGHKPDITAPDMNVDIPKGKFKGPNLKKPSHDVKAPDTDINASSAKLKMPKFGFSGSKPKGPNLEINSPELNLKNPKIKEGLGTPEIDLTLHQPDLEGPNLDIISPDIDINGPSGKFNMPKFKMPSFGLSGLKGPHINVDADIDQPDINLSTSTPKLNAGINCPDIDFHGPNADLRGPKTDLPHPDMDMPSRKLKMPTLKMPDIGLSRPKIKTPDYELKTPEMDLSASKIKADFDSPDMNVDMPKSKIKALNIKKPNLDMNALDFDTDAPSGKLKLPKVSLSGSKLEGPDLKLNSQKMNIPKIRRGIDRPDFQDMETHFDFGAHAQMHTNNLAVPQGKIKGAKTYDLDALSKDKRIPDGSDLDENWNTMSVPKLQASRSRENLAMTHSNMGMNPMRVSPQIVDNAGNYGRSHKIPKRHYTTDDICYIWKGMPSGDGRGNRQTEYGQTSSDHRQTIRVLQSHAMDLEVPESTLKVLRRFNPLKLMG